MLTETHHLDIKREIGVKPGDRAELARDLAQFAIDGGAVIVGVEEDKATRTWTLTPQKLVGLQERIEQIANSQIDPPLSIAIRVLALAEDPTQGYVVIQVPVSPRAPHMVGGIYYGRGETRRNRLSDAEVTRYHAARRDTTSRIEDLLQAEIDRDPIIAAGQARRGHLYLVAQPEIDHDELALTLLESAQGPMAEPYRTITAGAEQFVHQSVRIYEPSPGYASSIAIRSTGRAYCSQTLSDGRRYRPDGDFESDTVDIEVHEDGGIRAMVGRMTEEYAGRNSRSTPESVIFDGLAVAYAVRLVHWARMLSVLTGYHSGWLFGIAATGLEGRRSLVWAQRFPPRGPHYDQDSYRRTTTATLTEMTEHPGVVAKRLIGALLRGLGTTEEFQEAFSQPQN
ncbi:hypothetical protein Namu_2082 [Nakamurella multipartita DSM 44233]|uniref:Uncharacterized protein n=2 Tax=Nakamurella TaxID=53460 RepID=C8XI91_NAKMY|nr:hypothetical protein Namu_2082 [Nakamurella multipartita DSM 44233]